MKLLFVVLLIYGAWAFNGSSKTAGSLRCESPVGNLCEGPDWYWEKYNKNAIPSEAVDGTDCSDHSVPYGSLFVGNVHVPNVGILPGSIHAGSCQVNVYEAGRYHTLCEKVNILCSKRKSNIRWIKIHKSHIPCLEKVPGISLISGGYQKFYKLYIGRHYHEGIRQVGKIYPNYGVQLVNTHGTFASTYDDFEILVYISSQCNDPVEPTLPPPPAPTCPVYSPDPDRGPDIPNNYVVEGKGVM